jgi:hypothetical protein
MPKGAQTIKLGITEASRAFRVPHNTLALRLREAGHQAGPRSTYTLYDIAAALFGDEEKAKIRDTMASAALKEQKFRRLSRELLERSEVERIIAQVMSPLRQIITGASAELSAKVNPQDPHFARVAIEAWRDAKLVQVRDEIAKAAMDGNAEEEEEDEE